MKTFKIARWTSVSKAAKYSGMTEPGIRYAMEKGYLKHFKLYGSYIVVSLASLDKHIARRKSGEIKRGPKKKSTA